MKNIILFSIIIIIIAAMAGTAEAGDGLNYSDAQTATQVSDFTIPTNGSYIGAIQIGDIDPTKISQINVSADTYNMDIKISTLSWCGAICPDIVTSFKDKYNNRNETHAWSEWFPGTKDAIYMPDYGGILTFGIYNDRIYWVKNNQKRGNSKPLLNTPFNTTDPTNIIMVYPAQMLTIKVVGSDKVDVTYYIGTAKQLGTSSTNINTNPITKGTPLDAILWLLQQVPFIGEFLKDTVEFLTSFFNIMFSVLVFLVAGFDIIFMAFISFAMIHGIIIMAAGGTPFDGVKVTALDIVEFFKILFAGIVIFFGLIWKIVQAIGTFIQSIKPI